MAVNTPSPAAARPTPAARPRPGVRDAEYWRNLRYLAFGRALPAVLFGFMGWLQFQRLESTLPAANLRHTVEQVMPRALYLLFCAVPVVIYLTRPRPKRSDTRLLPRVIAFVATTMQLFVGAFAPDSPQLFNPPAWVADVSGILLLLSFAFALWGLAYLRRSLSIVPEARRLTTGGPYRLVRHPLYCGEFLAAVSIVLPNMKLISIASVLCLLALQLARTVYEEALLRDVFPEYADYARRTARVIPGVI